MDALERTEFDAIVVGTGPGGSAVARELARRGWNVLILERGPGSELRGSALQFLSQAMVPGRSLHFTPQMVALGHGLTLGGSSAFYYATAFEPPYAMFEAHSIDLRPEVEEVRKELPVAPLRDELIGPAARRIMESAVALGYRWERLPKIAYQEKCRPGCDLCVVGCPHGAKWSSRMFVEEACANGAILETHAHVRRVVHDGSIATGVEYTHRGSLRRAAAKVVVLGAGGLGTPPILRASGIEEVGKDFFFDPLIFVAGTVDGLEGGAEFPMATGCHLEDEGYMMTDLVLPRWLHWFFTAQVLRLDRLPGHRRLLPIMVKIRDELGGRLTTRGGVRKRLGEVERRRLRDGFERARSILEHAGARHIYKTWILAVHPGGTVKIGETVDSNLETRLENLYVCDCSVIPEAWGLPPSLTLLSLGKRLGKHLADRPH